MKLDKIGQIAIAADDLERAVAFYRDTLGMPLLFKAPPGLAFFDCGGIRLMLDAIREDNKLGRVSSLLYYKVADIHGVHKELAAKGVGFESTPHLIAKLPDHELWMAFFRDSENNLVGLMSEVR
jgi:methylmalonyl-CoA/ethylmalonyl-CoA epimerase